MIPATSRRLTLSERCDEALFRVLSSRNLIYNTCWEDPAVDRRALSLGSDDVVLAITSAGCNVLDYLLDGPRRVIAVDVNPRQTALLELKVAAIRALPYEDIFAFFGKGRHPAARLIYEAHLRSQLSPFAATFWDRRIDWFGTSGPFFWHGLSGIVARGVRYWLALNPPLRRGVQAMFDARDLDAQRREYLTNVKPNLWSPFLRWILGRQVTVSLLGVPMPQRKLVQAQYAGGIAGFIEQSMDRLFCTVPARSNYFWRVYAIGEYTEDCCPAYLRRDGIAALKAGLVDRLEMHSCSVTEYLDREDCPRISRFVLLDHMDWMSSYYPELLAEEWHAVHRQSTADARILFRSAHHAPPYLDSVHVGPAGIPLREWLSFREDEARELSLADRVHTYASFHIGHVRGVRAPEGVLSRAREAVHAG
ncbi:MAG TPA: BtaA family protein [Gemmatimonadaceae bacterium]|nr:BtaA family protein [Gemmatimonadaceae bacterium]